MTLRRKTFLIITLTFVCLTGLIYINLRHFVVADVDLVEEDATREHAQRTVNALTNDIEQLESLTSDWAGWDEAYTFMEDGNEGFVKSNIVDSTFTRLKLNVIIYMKHSGEIAAMRGFDLREQKEMPVSAT